MAYVHLQGSSVKDGGLAKFAPSFLFYWRSKNDKDRVEMR